MTQKPEIPEECVRLLESAEGVKLKDFQRLVDVLYGEGLLAVDVGGAYKIIPATPGPAPTLEQWQEARRKISDWPPHTFSLVGLPKEEFGEWPGIAAEAVKIHDLINKVKGDPKTGRDPHAIWQALQVTRMERLESYAHPIINFINIGLKWTYRNRDILQPGRIFTPNRVALMMADLKDARLDSSTHWDGVVDWIGYVDCADRTCQWLLDHNYVSTWAEGWTYFDGMTYTMLYEWFLDAERLIATEMEAAPVETAHLEWTVPKDFSPNMCGECKEAPCVCTCELMFHERLLQDDQYIEGLEAVCRGKQTLGEFAVETAEIMNRMKAE